ncbi:TadE-like protein [Rhizobium sp. PP-F2F-G38]|nr:TadE-like protein [Rhizobium sp. PP-WC-1G-195]PYE91912.1 TadE-like protein [Rhizobium sp. PP-F2F-G38]
MIRNRETYLRNFRKSRSGASAVEFALIAPVFLLLFAGTAEIGLATMTRMQVNEAVSAAVNRALISGAAVTAATADTTVSTFATMLRVARGGQSEHSQLAISFNGGRTYTSVEGRMTPKGSASAVDECRCPTQSGGTIQWGSKVPCATACPDKSLSARYVSFELTQPYKPLLPAAGLIGTEGIRIQTLAVLQ